MTSGVKAWLVYLAIVLLCLFFFASFFWAAHTDGKANEAYLRNVRDKAQRFDRICTGVRAPLLLARDRVRTTATVEAGRDLALVIAPIIEACTGTAAHRTRLESLARSNDVARDAAVIQGVLDELTEP